MPYRRRTTYKRKRPTYRRRKTSYKSIARIANKVYNKKAEKKYKLEDLTYLSLLNSGTTACLTDISQGDTDLTRDGDQLYLRSFQFRGNIILGDTNYNMIRMIVYQWYPATVPTIANILGTGVIYVNAPYNHDQRYNFKVLRDLRWTVDAQTPNKMFKFWIKSGFRRKIQYFSGSSTTANNMVYVTVVSDSGAVPNPGISFIYQTNFNDS